MTASQYQHTLLSAWLALPITAARRPSRHDRALALLWWQQAVPLQLALAALQLAAHRLSLRPADAPTLQPVRSLAYFLPLLDELQGADPGYLRYLAKPRSLRPDGDCPDSFGSS